jgi:hypothetical protein
MGFPLGPKRGVTMRHICWQVMTVLVVLVLLRSPVARSQQIEKVQPTGPVRGELLSKTLGVAREVKATARDFVTFRDPQWSVLTIAQIGAATADEVTTLNNFRVCPTCSEVGVSRFFVGQRPDAHKFIIGGAIEIGVEAIAAHYFRYHGPKQKLYWKALWALPQSFSLFEHAQSAHYNATLKLNCSPAVPSCN